MKLGEDATSKPKKISPHTRRRANFISDIDGAYPMRLGTISEAQRIKIMSGNNNIRLDRENPGKHSDIFFVKEKIFKNGINDPSLAPSPIKH